LPACGGTCALDQEARRLEIHHRDLGFEQRGLDPLALAGGFALGERDQRADRAIKPGGGIGDRDAGAHRALAGQPVTDIIPPMPWAIWSKPARVR
jgi:hypothetical protein